MKCPRCQSVFSGSPDASGNVVCASCGVKLRVVVPRPDPAAAAANGPSEPSMSKLMTQVLGELRSLRQGQQQILSLLRSVGERDARAGGGNAFPDDDDDMPAPSPATPVRSRRRKSVLLVDDDAEARQQAVDALHAAEVPVRAVADGNAGLAAMAEERPDVLVLELAVGGSMGGKDVVNLIKATMEWVDIPIVLYTRLPIETQKEARQIHGADELVRKGPASAEALVARVIALFRRA